MSQFAGSVKHLSSAVDLSALFLASSITVQKVSLLIFDIVLPNTGTYQVAYSSHLSSKTAPFSTLAFHASIFHSANILLT